MATITSPAADGSNESERQRAGSRQAGRRPRRWLRRVVAVLVVLAALVHAAPWVVAKTSLRNTLLSLALSAGQGTIRCDSASLGWYSQIELAGLEIRDGNDQPLAKVARLTSSKSLLALAWDQAALGVFALAEPELFIESRPDGTNVEDFIAPWLAPSDAPSSPLDVTVEVTGGRATLVDSGVGRKWQLADLLVRYHLPADTAPQTLELSATVAGGPRPATVSARMSLASDAADESQATLKTEALPLVALHSVLARFVPGVAVAGDLGSELTCHWQGDFTQATLAGQATIDRLVVTGDMLGSDRLALERVSLPIDCQLDESQIVVRHLIAKCDVGVLTAEGAIDLASKNPLPMLGVDIRDRLNITGNVDLAALATLLPETLSIRDDTRVTSGEARLNLTAQREAGVLRMFGELHTSRLAATTADRAFHWEQPIHVTFSAAHPEVGLPGGNIECVSDFLQFTLDGTPDAIRGTAQYDLDRLVAKLGQFIDLGQWKLAGAGQAAFSASRDAESRLTATATLAIDDFRLGGPDRQPWIEPHLVVTANATGKFKNTTVTEITTADLTVDAAADQLNIVLLRPTPVDAGAEWPGRAKIVGDVERWITRARPLFALDGLEIDGECDITAVAAYSPAGVSFEAEQSTVRDFKFNGYGLTILEPEMQFTATGAYDLRNSALDVADATLATRAVSMRAEQVRVDMRSALPSIAGHVGFNGNLDRLQRWFAGLLDGTGYAFAGDAQGTLDAEHQAGKTTARLAMQVANPRVDSVQPQRATLWQDRSLKIDTTVVHDTATDRLQLQSSRVEANRLVGQLAGVIDALSTEMRLDLEGTVDYDLANFAPLLGSYLGSDLRLVGRDQARFAISGPAAAVVVEGQPPHWSRRLQGTAAMGWQSIAAHGLEVGPARLQAQLLDGSLRFAPLDLTVSGGRLTSSPWIKLVPAPLELLLPKGPLLTDVAITTTVSDRLLKYIAPVLADATRTEGRFSVALEGGRVPLSTPEKSDLGGELTIHRVDVNAGPLANQVILLSKQIEAVSKRRPPPLNLSNSNQTLVTMNDQKISFRMVDGRVYHQGLEMKAGEVVVRTRGSVGVDQTLALVAEVPLLDKWIGNEPALAGLRGQVIPVTIRGTFQRPQIDARPVEQLAARLIQQAAERTITNEIGKQLDRLLKPR